ncbi:MAG: hypothetical protein B6I34_08830 [Anaerolineaceae bacterium 4572_32.1]|nr:MAG: hypothetical protein B6I34_08830 [Anaerolineaceae bacterium 4572_32.1]
MKNRYQLRLVLYGLFILLVFALLITRLYQLQIIQGDYFKLWADQNRFRLVPLDALRGIIYDRQGNILARNVPRFSVTIIPAYLPDDPAEEQALFQHLGELLHLLATRKEARAVARELGLKDEDIRTLGIISIQEKVDEVRNIAPYRPLLLKRNVERDIIFQIEEAHLDLPGVLVETEPSRQYPYGELISHVLGYTGPIPANQVEEYEAQGYNINKDRVGLIGAESAFEELLRGNRGEKYIEVDVAGREVRTIAEIPSTTGHNLQLSVDVALQEKMTEALQRGLETSGAKLGVTIAMNPQTGEILGMVSLPAYDNNLFSGGISVADYAQLSQDPHHPLINHAISGRQPPGSTFKIIPAAAALQEGVITRRTQIKCEGTMWWISGSIRRIGPGKTGGIL